MVLLVMQIASHETKSHIACHFDHLLTNGMVPFMTQFESCDTYTIINGIKRSVAHCLNHLDIMNTMVLLTMPLALHASDASAKCQMTEKLMLYLSLIILNY